MRTVHEVSKLTGVSIRTLQYYDKIGLLPPADYSASGYRLYDDTALEKLQQILLFRELEFSLKEIKQILDAPDFDRNRALEQQIELLTLKREHLDHLITFARGIQMIGVKTLDFSAFDTSKMDEYARQAKATWGNTPEYKEFQKRAGKWTKEQEQDIEQEFMKLFREFGDMRSYDPASLKVQNQVQRLQEYIEVHFYPCSMEILAGLGQMYAGGGAMTEQIDRVGGAGTGEFAGEAIQIYVKESQSR